MIHHRLTLAAVAIASVQTVGATAQEADSLTVAYAADACPDCAAWNAPQKPFQIYGNTYFVGTRGLSAILITSDEGHVLIDGGLPNSAPLIIENVRVLGFDVSEIKLILNSHAHFDHAGGIAALQRASGARVAANLSSAAVLEHGRAGRDDPQYGAALDFPPVAEIERFTDGSTVAVGSLSITAHRTAGHTPGSTTWTWTSCEANECLDLVFADSQTPVSADGFRFSDSRAYPSAVADFERGFAVLERLPCDILITPHPGASSLWERRATGTAGLVDASACRRYAAGARQQLARRLDTEASGR